MQEDEPGSTRSDGISVSGVRPEASKLELKRSASEVEVDASDFVHESDPNIEIQLSSPIVIVENRLMAPPIPDEISILSGFWYFIARSSERSAVEEPGRADVIFAVAM